MKIFIYILSAALLFSAPANAQKAFGEVTDEPLCFNVINAAGYKVYASIKTNFFERADGITSRHTSNFRMEEEEFHKVCTRGPFFEGRRLEFVIRGLVPIVDCRIPSSVNIKIYSEKTVDDLTHTWVECKSDDGQSICDCGQSTRSAITNEESTGNE